MGDQERTEESLTESDKVSIQKRAAGTANSPGEYGADVLTGSQPKPSKKLTPEEQMALYEENLKENDWGHQPC